MKTTEHLPPGAASLTFSQPGSKTGPARPAVTTLLVLALSLVCAGSIELIWRLLAAAPERAVLVTMVGCGAALAAVVGGQLWWTRRRPEPGTAALMFLATTSVLLLGIYFFWASGFVFFPGDFLVWTESDFVNDIIKFSTGYPLYSDQANNDSFVYVPGPQLLTYLLAWLVGKGWSIPAYRVIQLLYTAVAAYIGVLCCHRILRLARAGSQKPSWLWDGFCYAVILLAATNSITNPFTHNLHGDALAQLAAVIGYYLLLCYVETRSRAALAGLAAFAPLSFLVRQSFLAWAGWFAGYLAIGDRAWKRTIGFCLAVAALTGAVILICYAIWGQPFFYWTFYVLSKHGVSPLRAFQHLLAAWPFFAAGLLGGAAILGKNLSKGLLGAWVVWLGIISTETYTSGIAWMLNHIGPGSTIAVIWFLSGLRAVGFGSGAGVSGWIRPAAIALTVALSFNGMGLVRIPVRAVPGDAYRYVREIEQAFQGLPPDRVLLDSGTWVYVKDKVVMKDRAPSIGERGYSESGEFSALLARVRNRHYSRILVRGLHAPDFVYDYHLWPKSSGIRQAMLENYREAGTIRAAQSEFYARNWAEDPYYFGDITILEPRK